jgi:hypothetical protein
MADFEGLMMSPHWELVLCLFLIVLLIPRIETRSSDRYYLVCDSVSIPDDVV